MDIPLSPLASAACCLVPVVLVLVGAALFVLLPIVKAPTAERITRAARKYLKDHADVARPEMEKYLRGRFVPDERWDPPVESPDTATTVFFFGLFGLALRGLTHMLAQMRGSLPTIVVDNRINRVLDALDLDPGERDPDRPRRRRSD
jgi:hypothetical protein